MAVRCPGVESGCEGINLNCSAKDGWVAVVPLKGFNNGIFRDAYLNGTCYNHQFITTSPDFDIRNFVISCHSYVTDCYLACLRFDACTKFSIL